MNVLYLLLGDQNQASSRVRGYWVIEELEDLGFNCASIADPGVIGLLKCFFMIPFYNCLVLQKRYGRWEYYLIKFARLLGKKTVIDLDDKYSSSDNETTLKNLVRIMQSTTGVTVKSTRQISEVPSGKISLNLYGVHTVNQGRSLHSRWNLQNYFHLLQCAVV